MDLNQIPKPVWKVLSVLLLLTIGYGAATHVPGLNDSTQEKQTEKSTETTSSSKTVKVSLIDETSQAPIVGASVIIESEGGSDTDTTDNLGAFRVQIPTTEWVKIRINKKGCAPYNQNLNLLSNPDRPKQILLKCSIPKTS
ncbi:MULTISPECIES: hypothetical protein [Cyanophyceae]|uniref:hypothetical protein n=1 Tax=Cyanophyceae TaxID=3028117 RepID=UPI0016869AF3|nr:hypothetical protein [Trichocoleus sp. FACHB-69]MBD1932771.1 hypothetical protein [Trichocoleus sp. FACHB-69]